jgi:hypothetical protein
MSQPSNIHATLGEAIRAGWANGPNAVTGGTLDLQGKSSVKFSLGAGTYKLPNAATFTEVTVLATGAVILTTIGGTHIVSVASGKAVNLVATSTSTWAVANGLSLAGFIDIPLDRWREIATNDITNVAGNGGILATDSTPTLEYVNGDTDSQLRILWAAGNTDPIALQLTLPTDLDRTQSIVFAFNGVGGAADSPAMTVDAFFDSGDTKVETSTLSWTATQATRTATITSADIPSDALTMSVELTPATHATDTVTMYCSYITYTKKIA